MKSWCIGAGSARFVSKPEVTDISSRDPTRRFHCDIQYLLRESIHPALAYNFMRLMGSRKRREDVEMLNFSVPTAVLLAFSFFWLTVSVDTMVREPNCNLILTAVLGLAGACGVAGALSDSPFLVGVFSLTMMSIGAYDVIYKLVTTDLAAMLCFTVVSAVVWASERQSARESIWAAAEFIASVPPRPDSSGGPEWLTRHASDGNSDFQTPYRSFNDRTNDNQSDIGDSVSVIVPQAGEQSPQGDLEAQPSGEPISLFELNREEKSAVEDLRRMLIDRGYGNFNLTLLDLVKAIHRCNLNVENAYAVLVRYQSSIKNHNILQCSDSDVKKNYDAGFCERAGRDVQGRPMIWLRFKFVVPGEIPLDVGIKSTWMSLDASLMDLHSNRVGAMLVYDFADIASKNVFTLQIPTLIGGAFAVGMAHPSNIAKIVFLDAPLLFKGAWNTAYYVVPQRLRDLIVFMDSDRYGKASKTPWHDGFCERSALPQYFGGDHSGSFYEWMCMRLEKCDLPYRAAPSSGGSMFEDARSAISSSDAAA